MQNNKPVPWTPKEKLELVLLHLAKEEAVTVICEEAGVSRPLFYRWIKQVRRALQEALEAKKRGRRAKSILESPREAEALQSRIVELEREVAGLRRDRDRYKLVTEVAQRVIHRNVLTHRPTSGRPRGRPKKNVEPLRPSAPITSDGGSAPESSESEAPSMPPPGESIAPLTGGGPGASSRAPDTDIHGSERP